MKKATPEELNNAAMQMILFAGNSRNMVNEALRDTEQNVDRSCVDEKMKCAKEEITKAHKIQTDMIQSTIEDDELETTLLFTHAQDTLMTIYSELNMATHMIKMYRMLEDKVTSC
ncbi:PTS lactose/cellobiose transporter subunit IIA [[Eubacterium] hominis]|uniref:PTS lactose/cellobiose transporter subunit IIA n=1 Tax=[Eubacterium] hominis TaxID=2764325 RepID=UPI003A4E486C